jgi:hypothetical protein
MVKASAPVDAAADQTRSGSRRRLDAARCSSHWRKKSQCRWQRKK